MLGQRCTTDVAEADQQDLERFGRADYWVGGGGGHEAQSPRLDQGPLPQGTVENQGDWAVVDQADLHVGPEPTSGDGGTESLQFVAHLDIHRFRHGPRGSRVPGGASALPG